MLLQKGIAHMMKVAKIGGIILICVALIGALTYGLLEFANTPVGTKASGTEESIEESPEEEDVPEIIIKETNNEDLEELFPDDMAEKEMQDVIHFMTHGLVHAEQKWGKVEITAERVERLLEVSEQQQEQYEQGNTYVSILKRWNEGDFSSAVSDHNDIWGMLDGTVGKATRLFTQDEIEEYNKKHFE